MGEGGEKTKFKGNLAAIETLKQIEAEDRLATPEEQEVLSRYVGWGGLPQAFDEGNASWANEYVQLRAALTEEEYSAAPGIYAQRTLYLSDCHPSHLQGYGKSRLS